MRSVFARFSGISWPLAAVAAVALLVASCAAYAPARRGERIYRNVQFASPGGHDLRLDLYVPQRAQPVPVVVWIFGGSWKFGSKGFHVNVRDLTRHGLAVASIQYRLSGTARHPAQIDDCRAALTWLRTHGRTYAEKESEGVDESDSWLNITGLSTASDSSFGGQKLTGAIASPA